MTFCFCELCTNYLQLHTDGLVSCKKWRDAILFSNRICPHYVFSHHIRGIDI